MNYQEISVDEAIKKGIWFITIPAISFILISIFSLIYFSVSLNLNKYYTYSGTFIIIAITILYGYLALSKWKIWAFGNVRNVQELKIKAVSNNLFFTGNSYLDRHQFYTKSDKLKWQEIEKKFLIPDELIYNPNLQKEIKVYKSKIINYLLLCVWILILFGSLYLVIFEKESLGYFGILSAGLLLYFKIIEVQKINIPLLTINDKGIKIDENVFYNWIDITNLRTHLDSGYRSRTWFLQFDYKGENVGICIDYIILKRRLLLNYLISFKNQSLTENNSELK